ncbi:MAG: hypothetical protein ACKVJG_28605 [Candidatus Latescibacterota bacterium]|mgnify:CR=1 FL=1
MTVAKERLDALGVKAVCIATPVGHQTEIAIPQAYFEQRQGEDWQALRLMSPSMTLTKKQVPWRSCGGCRAGAAPRTLLARGLLSVSRAYKKRSYTIEMCGGTSVF